MMPSTRNIFTPQFFIIILLASLQSVYANAEQNVSSNLPLISVSAEGKVKALPDQAIISLRFHDTQLEADDARKTVRKSVDRFLNGIERFAIKEDSLDTSQTRINPQYNYRNNQRQFIGYQFERTVQFTLSDLDQLEQIIKLSTQAESSQLNQMQFSVSKPATYRNKALNRAIANAKKTAKKIASNFEVNLGKIHSVDYQSYSQDLPIRQHRAQFALAESSEGSSNSYQQQALEFQANIKVSFNFN